MMAKLHLRIITPHKVVREEEVTGVTVPAIDGEISILPRHTKLLSALQEGIIVIRDGNKEDVLAIGGGYVETDGKTVQILVSRAYGQDEIDEAQTKKALEDAKNLMSEKKDGVNREEALMIVRRSIIDLKLLKRRKRVQNS